jgi:integrase/recombinase XerD
MIPLSPLLESFFTERLMKQRQASSNTLAAYRDAFTLLLRFAQARVGRAPSELFLEDIDSSLIGSFLDHLEVDRGNKSITRNARLAAIHSFFRFIAPKVPERSELVQRVLAIPQRRWDRDIIDFLTPEEFVALLAAPDQTTWVGRRDHGLLLLAIQTGLRVSEITGLRIDQLTLGAGAHIRCHGKGRKNAPLLSCDRRSSRSSAGSRSGVELPRKSCFLRDVVAD